MELRQSRPSGGEGERRKATQDYLSLCSQSATLHTTSSAATTTPPRSQAKVRACSTDNYFNCSSYTDSGFMLWEEPAGKKRKTGKENVSLAVAARGSEVRSEQWNASEKPAQSSSNYNYRSSLGSFSSYQPSGQKSKSFMDMIKSAKGSDDAEDELDDEETEFALKKESPPASGELWVKLHGKSDEQKANTPRSKHSATEQRRRSKINDRFQMLRALIPHSDQKRDRASFLLEVVDYIQLLQEKVTKYEGCRQEPAKVMPLRNGQRLGNGFINQACPATNGSDPCMFFAPKKGRDSDSMMSANRTGRDADISSANPCIPQGIGNNVFPFPISSHPNHLADARTVGQVAPVLNVVAAGFDHKPWTTEYATDLSNKLKEEDLTVEGGSICFSNVYSHGLLNTLTQALQSSGLDLSQASISVKIELGGTGNPRAAAALPFPKDGEVAASKVQCIPRTRARTKD